MEHLQNKRRTVLWHLLMLVLMLGSAVLIPVLREEGQAASPFYYLFAAVLALAVTAYAFFFEPKLTEGMLFWLSPLLYVISFAFILLFEQPLFLPFWCFGGILLLCTFGVRYGLLLNYFFLFLIGSTQQSPSMEALVMQFLCLLLLGILMPYVKKWTDAVNVMISLAAVIVSVRLVFFFAVKQELLTGDIFSLAAAYTVVVIASFLFSGLLRENVVLQTQKEYFDFLEELAAGVEEQEMEHFELSAADGERTESGQLSASQELVRREEAEAGNETVEEKAALAEKLRILCDEETPLLARLSGEHPAAFLHARRVALIAGQVSKQLEDVDSLLVLAGGYYHEIGRLRGKNTLENTLAVAEQEGFPTALKKILLEHTVNGDKPTSKEAAVLLLTDNICNMCEYLKKTQKGKILVVKVIDKALSLRVSKEDLNQSGLTVKDFSVIRNTMTEIIKEDMF